MFVINLAEALRHRGANKLTAIQLGEGFCSGTRQTHSGGQRTAENVLLQKSGVTENVVPTVEWKISVSPPLHFKGNKALLCVDRSALRLHAIYIRFVMAFISSPSSLPMHAISC